MSAVEVRGLKIDKWKSEAGEVLYKERLCGCCGCLGEFEYHITSPEDRKRDKLIYSMHI